MLAAVFSFACGRFARDVPPEVPVTPPVAAASPLPKLDIHPHPALDAEIAKIAEAAKGRVGVAAVVLKSGNAAFLNANERFPMQSVYKLPISMAIMDQIRHGRLSLDEKVGVTKDDFVRAGMRSPLRDENPNGGEFTVRELIRLALVESDGTASDVLIRVGGGAGEMQSFLTQIGVEDMKVVHTEKELGRDWPTQYEDWSTPAAAVEMLRWLYQAADCGCKTEDPLDKGADELDGQTLVVKYMADSVPGAMRLKGLLPKGTFVAHKTGTSGTKDGLTGATNDIGIIRMPNGKVMVVAVFVSDSTADERTREAVIARIAKALWDKWSGV